MYGNEEAAKAFQNKLGRLKFFDPACGSGNFLTETYLSLRKMENEALKLMATEAEIVQHLFKMYEELTEK